MIDISVPIRVSTAAKHIFKSLSFLESYLHLDIVYKEMLEEYGYKTPLWLEYDIMYWQEKVESYRRR